MTLTISTINLLYEKRFIVEEKFNRYYDRVYAHNSWEAAEKIQRVK